jgi:hypothetical protein
MQSADPTSIDLWLAAARRELRRQQPPPWVAAQLRASLAARGAEHRALHEVTQARRGGAAKPAPRAARGKWPALPWFLWPALAAVLLLVVGLVGLPPTTIETGRADPLFVALAPIESIRAEPARVVVAAQVPRAVLATYGLPIDPARADEPARAELLMSAQGVVLAVRLLP